MKTKEETRNTKECYYVIKFRWEILQQIEVGILDERQACEKYGISLILIRKWRRQNHKRHLQPQLTPKPMKRKQSQTEKIKALEKQLEETQKALEEEKLKSRAYEIMIEKEFPLAGVEKSCRLFGLTWDAFYKVEKRANTQCLQEALVLREVRKIKEEQPKLGTEKVHQLIKAFLSEHDIKMGRDKLYDLLRRHHLLPKRKRKRPGTTQSRHKYFKYPNLVKDLEISRPNHAWKNDITYIRCGNGFNYLSLTTDAYSRKIIGWSLQPSLRAEGPIEALQMALKTIYKNGRHCGEKKYTNSPTQLIHHSDKGHHGMASNTAVRSMSNY